MFLQEFNCNGRVQVGFIEKLFQLFKMEERMAVLLYWPGNLIAFQGIKELSHL